LATKIGGALRSAREERGLSQEALGELLGYAPTMISAFETGRRRMKVEDLARASIALDKDPAYFLSLDPVPDATIGLKLRAELQELGHEELAGSIEKLLDEVEALQPSGRTVPDLAHFQPEAAARKVLDLVGAKDPPVEMEAVCEALGIPLYWRNLPDALSAVVVAVGDGYFVIAVNKRHHVHRRRFSIAHEVAHAVLRHKASHYIEYAVEDMWEPPGFRYFDEREANSFAAAVLMDERWLRRDYAAGMRTVPALARRYGVSTAAMGFRLTNLQLTG
jgi:transcriptional regulator with XRE-family HTH domain